MTNLQCIEHKIASSVNDDKINSVECEGKYAYGTSYA